MLNTLHSVCLQACIMAHLQNQIHVRSVCACLEILLLTTDENEVTQAVHELI